MFHFGKWILISSTVSYITMQASPLIMGGFITMAELGTYSLAAGLAGIILILAYDLSRRVLHPYFKESFDQNKGFRIVRDIRLLFNSGFAVICIIFALFGDKLIAFLYDDRYLDAGWMLQILAVGQIGRSMSGTLMPFLLAKGDSFSQMTVSACGAALLMILITLGGTYYGSEGVIIGYTLSGLLTHPVMIFLAARHGYNCALHDIPLMITSIGIVIIFWVMTNSAITEKFLSLDWL
jgi:O-antigen/teichoic acid export membrane protein